MSVSSVDRHNTDSRVRDTREEYEGREEELLKRKNEEIKRAEKRHREEVQRLTDQFESQIDQMRDGSKQTLSERDQKYQNEIANLKTASMQQMRKKMQEDAAARRELSDTYKSEIDKTKDISESQRENLIKKGQEENQARDQRLSEILTDSHVRTKEAIENHREKLNQAHEKEKSILKSGSDDALSRERFERDQLVKSYKNEINNKDREITYKDEAWKQKYYDTVNEAKSKEAENLKSQSELLDSGLRNVENRYQKKLQQKLDTIDNSNDVFKDSVSERVNTQVRSRDSRIKDLENKLNNEINYDQKRRSIERKNITDDYEKRLNEMEEEKIGGMDRMKELSHDRVNHVIDRNDQVLRQANRENKSEMSLLNTRNREERANLVDQHSAAIEHEKTTADQRVKKLLKVNAETDRTLQKYHEGTVAELRDGYHERIAEQRDHQIEDQNRLTLALTTRYRNMENKMQDKLDQTVSSYENKLETMKDNYEKDLKHMEQIYQQRLADINKGHKQEKDSLEQKYEARIVSRDEQHNLEVDKINRKHDEDMRNLSQRLNNYSRKA